MAQRTVERLHETAAQITATLGFWKLLYMTLYGESAASWSARAFLNESDIEHNHDLHPFQEGNTGFLLHSSTRSDLQKYSKRPS